ASGVAVEAPRLVLGRITPPPGDDTLKFSGAMTLPVPVHPPLHLVQKGLRLVIDDANEATVADLTVPGGAYDGTSGWTSNSSGWRYRSRTGSGITKIAVKPSSSTPGTFRIT